MTYVATAGLSIRVRLLTDPPLWCWEIADQDGHVVESSWDSAWTGYASRREAQAAGGARLRALTAASVREFTDEVCREIEAGAPAAN